MSKFVCTELSGYQCLSWEEIELDTNTTVLQKIYDDFAITKSEMVMIGEPMIGVLVLCVAYTFLSRAINLL